MTVETKDGLHTFADTACTQAHDTTTETFKKPESARKTTLHNEMTLFEIIAKNLSLLNEKHRIILQQRYGCNGDTGKTLQEIGNNYGVTRERIRQIEANAKQKLKTEYLVKTLIAALNQKDILDKLFKNPKIISRKQIKSASKILTVEERLAIDLAYGDLKSFLDTEAVEIEGGWVQKHDLALINQQTKNLTGASEWKIRSAIKKRLKSAVRSQHLPIRLSRIASLFPDYSLLEISDAMSRQFGAIFKDDLLEKCPKLSTSTQCILILRDAGRAMHFNEVKTRIHKVFTEDKKNQHIGSILANLKETLIVGMGTYNLYENLGLSENSLEEIRARAFHYLKNVDGFMQSSALFSDLFQRDSEQFGTAFGHYMLLGILQDDKRFKTRRRMKVGLAATSDNNDYYYKPLVQPKAIKPNPVLQVNPGSRK